MGHELHSNRNGHVERWNKFEQFASELNLEPEKQLTSNVSDVDFNAVNTYGGRGIYERCIDCESGKGLQRCHRCYEIKLSNDRWIANKLHDIESERIYYEALKHERLYGNDNH